MRAPMNNRKKKSISLTRFASGSMSTQSSNLDQPPIQLVSTCDCKKINSMFSAFDSQKATILSNIGFDGLLKLPAHEKLNDDLTLWLYNRLDFKNMTLNLQGGVELPITAIDVFLILGIPFEGQSVRVGLSHSKEAVTAFKNKISIEHNSPSLTLAYLECIMNKDYGDSCIVAEKDALKVAIVMYSLCYFLSPESNHDFPVHLMSNFIPDVEPQKMNWAQFVLLTLSRAAAHVQCQLSDDSEKIVLFGCSLLIQVFYLDNLNFGPSTPYHVILPRSKVYLPETITELLQSDSYGTSADKLMQFGKAEVRAGSDVCYSRGWLNHTNVHSSQLISFHDDFTSSIEFLSQGLKKLDQFAAQLNTIQFKKDTSALDSLVASQRSFDIIRSKLKESIHGLSNKAASLLKASLINLYHQHLPANSHKHKHNDLGTSQASSSTQINSTGTCHLSVPRTANSKASPLCQKLLEHRTRLIATRAITARQNGQQQFTNNNGNSILFEKKTVTSHSNFPISIFDLIPNNADVPTYKKLRTYDWMTDPALTTDELDRDWIVFTAPTSLSISGHVVRDCLKLNGIFSVNIVDAIMVLWNYLDDVVYKNFQRNYGTQTRWRHFLPASFAETVLGHGDYLRSSGIRSYFIGDHIGYNIADCQKLVMPVLLLGSWSCYFWDFKFKTITVLDPMLMNTPPGKAKQKHRPIVYQLHKALLASKNSFFCGWDTEQNGWSDVYGTDLDHSHNLRNSGLYAVHYARAYSGEHITFPLKEPNELNLSPARGKIVYQLFQCGANKGYKPNELMALLG